jgi:AcrR family transcriptional regulator
MFRKYMTITQRRDRERQEMRTRILDAALALFVAEGYDHVSLRRIAERIEYSAATIYLYFSDKDDIFFALLKQGFDLLVERQDAVQGIEDARQRLFAHGRAYVEFAEAHPELYEIMFNMHGPAKVMLREQDFESSGRSYQLLRANVSECMDAGYFKGEHLEIVAFSLWSLVHGMASLAISGRLKMMPADMLRMLVDGSKEYMQRFVSYDAPAPSSTASKTPRSKKAAATSAPRAVTATKKVVKAAAKTPPIAEAQRKSAAPTHAPGKHPKTGSTTRKKPSSK